AANEQAGTFALAQHGRDVDAIAIVQVSDGERTVGAGIALDHALERVGHVGKEDARETAGRWDAERVAIEPGVIGGDHALLAADADAHGTALTLQHAEHGL